MIASFQSDSKSLICPYFRNHLQKCHRSLVVGLPAEYAYEMERFQLAFRYIEPSKLLLYACSDIIRIGKRLAPGFMRENNWTRKEKMAKQALFC